MTDRASDRLLFEEAWRNERILNHLRVVFLFFAVTEAGIIQAKFLDTVSGAIWVIAAWALFLLIFSHTWLKRHFARWVPWALATVEIGIIAFAMILGRRTALEFVPEVADRQIVLFFGLLLLVLGTNILRFTWRLSLFCTGLIAVVLVSLEIYWDVLSPLTIPEVVLMLALGALITYSSHRFLRLMRRLAVEIRRVQAERIAALRSLVAGLCHELNTPLGALHSNAQLSDRVLDMIKGSFSEEELGELDRTRPKLAKALKNMERMSKSSSDAIARIEDTVSSLKNFARLDEADVKPIHLRDAVEAAVRLLSTELSNVEIERDWAELPKIAVRPGEINQVFMHVIRNAAQSMPDGGKIQVRTRLEETQAIVEIVDHGVGIPKARLENLFLPTFSSNEGRTKMGFGLSASQTIVRDHGGEISVTSEVSRGTTVRIELPIDGPA